MVDRFTKGNKVDLQEVLHPMTRTRDLWLIVKGILTPFHTLCYYYSSSSPFHQQFGGQETNHNNFHEFIDQAQYESDEFRMFVYKLRKCPILHSHDWTSCPFTHQGEKTRRRDPRKYNYLPIPCPAYKFASCIKGDNCELCHGVFEEWLHPAKYRTQLCHAGTSCDRQICFFAHTWKELRPETKYNWRDVYLYPLDIQPYPDILIENGPNGYWMVIPCKPQPTPTPHDQSYGTTISGHGNSSTPQQIQHENTSTFELFVSPPPFSQSQPRIDQTIQNERDFSLYSASHAKLFEELKNLAIGTSSHDEKGKRPVEFESQDQEFPNIN
ncbi:zinc finger CCCH domain-containing protein 47-like [Lycium ferocissimum]|uniref:zinc finger CCCH domain-containing protein 47-like n=1 Tax=Lycium ferocissimum TaxID=112874 RepID=UPI00281569AC|nr:zinc finger CCCH domain-containing protein 47-like [Lycium ferocissimum]